MCGEDHEGAGRVTRTTRVSALSSVPSWLWHMLPPAQTTVASVPTAQYQAGTWQCSAHSTKGLCSLCWFPFLKEQQVESRALEDSRSGHCLQARLLGALGRRQVQERRGSRLGGQRRPGSPLFPRAWRSETLLSKPVQAKQFKLPAGKEALWGAESPDGEAGGVARKGERAGGRPHVERRRRL